MPYRQVSGQTTRPTRCGDKRCKQQGWPYPALWDKYIHLRIRPGRPLAAAICIMTAIFNAMALGITHCVQLQMQSSDRDLKPENKRRQCTDWPTAGSDLQSG